jgi:hypothetical protein
MVEEAVVPPLEPAELTEDAVLRWLDHWERDIRKRAAIYAKNPDMGVAVASMVDAMRLLPDVRQACRGASPAALDALVSALVLGLLLGYGQTWGYAWYEEQNRPDTRRGRTVKKGAARGGKETKELLQARSAEPRRKAVTLFQELHRKYPRRSEWDLCQEIGRALNRHPRTVKRYLDAAA